MRSPPENNFSEVMAHRYGKLYKTIYSAKTIGYTFAGEGFGLVTIDSLSIDSLFCAENINSEPSEDRAIPVAGVKWTRPEVLYLFELYKAKELRFTDKKTKKKTLWEEISVDMKAKGFNYSGQQCETKFKNLKQNYTKTVDYNNTTGNDRKQCPYFAELSDIFGLTPCVKPISVCSSRQLHVSSACASSSTSSPLESSSENEVVGTPQEVVKRPAKRKRSLNTKEDLIDVFKQYQTEQKKRDEEKQQKQLEMHAEKMSRFDRLLDLYERDIAK